MKTRSLALAVAATAATGGIAFLPTATANAEPCGGTYTHCETNQCVQGVFYLNYNPTEDHFTDPYGGALTQGEQGDIRDEPYRRYGPRGVRAMHSGRWGFYSTGCFP
jgi:hypothetical protein